MQVTRAADLAGKLQFAAHSLSIDPDEVFQNEKGMFQNETNSRSIYRICRRASDSSAGPDDV